MSFFEDTARPWILEVEGGYVNDPQDPGGETKYGISKRSYPNLDIAALTQEQAGAIYLRDYWQAAGCDGLPQGLALIHFDAAVNCGVHRAMNFLNLARQASDSRETYLNIRRGYYVSLVRDHPALAKFEAGWLKRLEQLRVAAQAAANLG